MKDSDMAAAFPSSAAPVVSMMDGWRLEAAMRAYVSDVWTRFSLADICCWANAYGHDTMWITDGAYNYSSAALAASLFAGLHKVERSKEAAVKFDSKEGKLSQVNLINGATIYFHGVMTDPEANPEIDRDLFVGMDLGYILIDIKRLPSEEDMHRIGVAQCGIDKTQRRMVIRV